MLATSHLKAKSSLAATSDQLDVVSRNVARHGDANATRKLGGLTTRVDGQVGMARISRSVDEGELRAVLSANATSATHSTVSTALTRLQTIVGEVSEERSPAAQIGKLLDSVQVLSTQPADAQRAATVISTAHMLARTLNEASAAVSTLRQDIDAEIATFVDRLRAMLGDLEATNRSVVAGTAAKRDVTDLEDQRDALVKQISEIVGVRTIVRENNDLMLFTESGVTLLETTARPIAFRDSALQLGVAGQSVFIDGVSVAGVDETMPLSSGRLRALVDLRDETTDVFQAQLDEIARGLVSVFSERAESSHLGFPDVPGLFTFPGATVVPPAAARIPGLASTIQVKPAYDPARGGNANLLRDGGSAGPAYSSNVDGAAGYNGRLLQVIERAGQWMAFDARAGLVSDQSLSGFSANSVAALAEIRKRNAEQVEYHGAVQARLIDTLAGDTGVSLDQEMSHMLELERSYQASSRLLTSIDEMYRVLLATAS